MKGLKNGKEKSKKEKNEIMNSEEEFNFHSEESRISSSNFLLWNT